MPSRLFPLREKAPRDLFAEDYFAYFEDLELGLYGGKKGGRAGIVTAALVKHRRGKANKLGAISREQWQQNPMIIEKMILNRYLTLARYKKESGFLRKLPGFVAYELVRWVYITLRKPFLLALLWPSLKILFGKNETTE